MPDDYSPVAEQGELEAGSGLRARMRRREELAPLGPGFERVLLAENGTPLAGDGQLTPGEKRYLRARSWVRVDVAHHRLDYRIAFSDPSGEATFVATVDVDVAVRDAVEAVCHGATSVKDVLEPALRSAVASASEPAGGDDDTAPGGNRVNALSRMRSRAGERIAALRQQPVSGVPAWLEATVTSTAVEFDERTQRHLDELLALTQNEHKTDITGRIEEKRVLSHLRITQLWREALIPHLSDPSARVFEQVFHDPTSENIASAVAQANEREMLLVQQVVHSFQEMAKEGVVEKDDPGVRAFVGLVERLPEMFSGGGRGPLGAGASSAALGGETSPAADADADADAHTEVTDAPEVKPGDRDFSD